MDRETKESRAGDTSPVPLGPVLTRGVADLLTLDCLEPLRYIAPSHAGTSARLYGGEVAGQAAVAAAATVPRGRILHSLHAYFLLPGDPSVPVEFTVGRARDGGSFSARTVHAHQGPRVILAATASFQDAEPGLSHQQPRPFAQSPEDVPDIEDGLSNEPRSLRWARGVMERLPVQLRFPEGLRPAATSADSPAILRVWMRSRLPMPADPVLHKGGLVYLSDLLMLSAGLQSHPHLIDDDNMQIATISHTVYLHQAARADDWLLYELESDWAGGGRCLTRGRLFDRTGVLCLSTVQEGLIRAR
jgi:acyl-CoA thioesterase-2